MQMTNEEIVRSYKEAKHKKEQVGILAELNACTRSQIIEILRAGGIENYALARVAGDIKASAALETPETPETPVFDFTVLSARIDALLEQRDSAEKELHTIYETLAKLLLKMKDEGGRSV